MFFPRYFVFSVMFEKKTRDNPKYLSEESESRVEHKKSHISEMREKKKKSDIGR